MEPNLTALVESARDTLLEGLALVESINNECYATSPRGLQTDSAGNHVRHCLEFFECFLDGLDTRVVDYAARDRNRDVGQDRLLGMLRIAEVVDRLGALRALDPCAPISVRAEDEKQGVWTPSTLGRELEFLRSHTVHHYALIALIVRAHKASAPSSFGVAPSTLRFRAGTPTCAR